MSFSATLKEDDKVDVFNKHVGCWFIETVDYVARDGICTSQWDFHGSIILSCEYSTRLSQINNKTIPINPLNEHSIDPVKMFYDSKINSVFIIDEDSNVFTYNIETNKYKETVFDYEEPLLDVAFNRNGRLLVLLYENHLRVLNVDSLEWSEYPLNIDDENIEISYFNPKIIYIPQPINEYHIRSDYEHYKWDPNTQQLIELNDWNTTKRDGKQFIYIKLLQKLFMFGGWSYDFHRYDGPAFINSIFYCNVNATNQANYKWQPYKISLPLKNEHFEIILSFGYIVFIFYDLKQINFDISNSIYVLDLLHNKIFKFQNDRHLSYLYNFKMVISNKRGVHIMSRDISFDGEFQFNHIFKDNDGDPVETFGVHYTFSLYDVIPKEMMAFYKNKYNPLIYGFVKESNKYYIPIALVEMILNFFPSIL